MEPPTMPIFGAARERLTRAHISLMLAEQSLTTDWEAFKVQLETAIVFGRAVLHYINKHRPKRRCDFRPWFDSLEATYPVLVFFRQERDFILHERVVGLHAHGWSDVGARFVVAAPGEPPPPSVPEAMPTRWVRIACFDDAAWGERPALDVVGEYLDSLERIIDDAERRF